MFLNKETKKEKILTITTEIFGEIFKVSLLTYLVFYLIESFKTGFITDYLNLNIILYVTIISGVIFTFMQKKEHVEAPAQKKLRWRDIIFIVLLGIAASFLIYYKIKTIVTIAYVVSAISGVIIILISFLLMQESGDGTEEGQSEKPSAKKHD